MTNHSISNTEDEMDSSIFDSACKPGDFEVVTDGSNSLIQMRNQLSRQQALRVYVNVRTNPYVQRVLLA
jgi:hypothetical protein